MAKIFKNGGTLILENGTSSNQFSGALAKVRFSGSNVTITHEGLILYNGDISGLLDSSDSAYTIQGLKNLLASFNLGVGGLEGLIFVDSINKLPEPVEGVYTLDGSYFFTKQIDFDGANVVFQNASIIGTSQEKAGIKNANISILSTTSFNWIRFDNCALSIDAIGGAFDWTKVNFYGCGYLDILNASNVILETIGFINSMGVNLVGEIDSFVLSPNCIFIAASIEDNIQEPDGYENASFLNITSTATINRRVRVQDSVFSTSYLTQKAINFESGASIPIESLILKTVGFNGIGAALSGINGDDDRTSFFEVNGGNSLNSSSIGSMVMKSNTVATTVGTQDESYKVNGVFEEGAIMQRFAFDAVNNALEYTSIVPRTFIIQAPFTVRSASGANVVTGTYIGVKKASSLVFDPAIDTLTESEQYTTNSNSSRPDSGSCQAIAKLGQGDKIYMITENKNGTQDIVHEFINIIAQRASI